ncbi:MAG: amidohydrolase/deacetylase family metallohydrolase [Spirochaetaceae bacterium]|nr:MAG: amidohydrolase/deacetylase family metallohydrolase [Spirochaetaceae bacterium]
MAAHTPTDLVITGGRVVDPANGVDRVTDIAIQDGRIAAVGDDLPVGPAMKVVDARGLLVTPGLIDIHVHVYHTREPEGLSVIADHHSFRSGVTTVVDTGTAGANHFLHFKRTVIDQSKTRIFAFVNVVKSGMIGPFEHDPAEMDPEQAAGTVLAYPEICVGIKTAHYWTHAPFDEAHTPWLSVDRGIESARLCRKPLMVDFFPRPERPYDELLRKMSPGDIHTHVFAQQFPVLDERGRPNRCYQEARERGIVFDLGHGAGSFWFRNAIPCFRQGFYPDSISTDIHKDSINGPVFSMVKTMSKMLAIGMSMEDVIEKSTAAPAREIGHPELGTLTVGSDADVALLRVDDGEFAYFDCAKVRVKAQQEIACAMTIRAGEIVYDENALSMEDWIDAPETR